VSDEQYAFLRRVCRKALRRWNCSKDWSLDEFTSWGWWGLACAERTFDEAKGSWHPYAAFKIRGAILDNLKQGCWKLHARWTDDEQPVYQPNPWHEALYDLTKTLNLPQRQAVCWYYRDGLSLADIGKLQGVTESAVSYRLKDAREKIRQLVLDAKNI